MAGKFAVVQNFTVKTKTQSALHKQIRVSAFYGCNSKD